MNDEPLYFIDKTAEPRHVVLDRLIESRIIRIDNPPPIVPPTLKIGKVPIAKVGDITVIGAQAKSGKTAFVGGIIAAAISSENGEPCDSLGVSTNQRPPNGVVIWVDTEQSERDAWDNLKRAYARCNNDLDPHWLRLISVVGIETHEIREVVLREVQMHIDAGKTIWFVVLDGITDLVEDVNDLPESKAVINELRESCRKHNYPVIAVMHRNEGEKASTENRGHIGKELNRKAAFVLMLEKDADEITTVWLHRGRGAPLSKDLGPRFRWSDNEQRHVTVNSQKQSKASEKKDELTQQFQAVFAEVTDMTYLELKTKLATFFGGVERTQERRIHEAHKLRIINIIRNGRYSLL